MNRDDDNESDPGSTGDPFDALLREVARSESREAPSKERLIGSTLGYYRVLVELGRGGMGVVYGAEDTRLGRNVALKVLPPSVTGNAQRRLRFLREARSAAAINHPNIATVYDVGEADGRLFLAMERVEGATLRTHLLNGPLPLARALGVARQVALGLSRAHERGVVHRDIKPENVMLTHDGDVKILDFGIAKLQKPSSADPAAAPESLTLEGHVVGTPGYMSPEQASGKPVDERTDVYALGVVLHEMLTGELPGAHGSGRVVSDPRVATIVTRSLARAAEDRWGAADVLQALDGLDGSRRPRAGWERAWSAVAVLAIVVATGGWLVRSRQARGVATSSSSTSPTSGPDAGPRAASRRVSLAIWPLREVSPGTRAAWLGVALGETLRADLSADEALLVARGADVAHAKRDLAIADDADLPPTDAMRAAVALGVPLLVEGSYAVDPSGRLRLEVRVVDAKTGSLLGAATQSGKEDDLFDLVAQASTAIRQVLQAPPLSGSIAQLARAAMPAAEDAARAYSEGLAAIQSLDYAVARERFQRAVALDDKAAMPHAMLSQAFFELGYIQKAAAEARAALDRAPDSVVTREERLTMEARASECAYDWAGAIDHWQVLSELFPDDVDYGLALARALKRGGDPKRAIATIDALRRLPGASADPRLDLVAGDAAATFDFEAQAKYGAAALTKARGSGSRSLALEAEVIVARADQNLGHNMEVLPQLFAALERRYVELGNRAGAIQASIRLGFCLKRLRRVADAVHALTRAVADAHAYGYVSLEAQALLQRGAVKMDLDPRSCMPDLVQARDIARSSGDRWTESQATNNVGLAQWTTGSLDDARASFDAAAKIAGAIGYKTDETNALDNLALIEEGMGNFREALAVHEAMAKRYLQIGNSNDWVITVKTMAGILLAMGDPVEAEKRLDEAETERDHSEGTVVADLDWRRGEILVERGQLEEGRALLQRVIAEALDAGAPDQVSRWSFSVARIDVVHGTSRTAELVKLAAGDESAILAASRLLDGQRERATADARRAAIAASKDEAYLLRVPELVLAAEVLARTSHAAEALAIVRPIAADAEARGIVRWALEARLVAARATADRDARDTASRAVESEARTHGLMDLASRAAAATRGP